MKASVKHPFIVVIIFVVLATTVIAQSNGLNSAPIKNLGAGQSGNIIKITWTSESETGIKHYEIWRDNECVRDNLSALGSNQFYSIDDNKELYKTTGNIFRYKVRAIYSEDHSSFLDSPSIVVSYNSISSTAKRTWGSIKAMFR
jgi:hypothetical protein